jgi:D-sedoheptulose 7-phosphate isomerase
MMEVQKTVDELIERYPVLNSNRDDIVKAYEILVDSYEHGGKLLVTGNGGSSADADHIVGELMKGFILPRRISDRLRDKLIKIAGDDGMELSGKLQNALPSIALTNHNSLNTAFSNDVDGDMCFAQQTLGYGVKGDVFMGISTSGNSKNVLYAAMVAKAMDLKVIALTGAGGGRLEQIADVTIAVDEKETYKVQELHLPVYHCLCMMLEQRFFGGIGS